MQPTGDMVRVDMKISVRCVTAGICECSGLLLAFSGAYSVFGGSTTSQPERTLWSLGSNEVTTRNAEP